MKRKRSTMTAICGAALALLPVVAPASPFATTVVDYSPGPSQYDGVPAQVTQFMTASKALGAPVGETLGLANVDSVVTLGDGGSLTLAFDHDVVDDPANPGGYDFIVFGNAFFVAGNYANRWQEPAYVEISQDGVTWYLINPSPSQSVVAAMDATAIHTTALTGYTDCTPVLRCVTTRTPEEFFIVPDRQSVAGNSDLMKVDAVSPGGDAFDIAAAVQESAQGVPLLDASSHTIPAGISSFRYIRITSVHFPGTDVDLGEVSADIDGASDVAPAISVGAARKLSDGGYAVIYGAKVTAKWNGDGFRIEQPDRSAGLKVMSATTVAEGDSVAVTGHVTTDTNGERVIADPLVTVLEHGVAPPTIGIANRTASLDMLSTMLVRVWGKRTAGTTGQVTIDDGSGLPVNVQYGTLTTVPDTAQWISATGIISRDASGSPYVRIRKAGDITYY